MIDNIYPYEKDPERHPMSWVFFNAPGVAKFDLDSAEALAKHVFDNLGCGLPGSATESLVIYDALGTSGAPWEPGRWSKVEDGRMAVQVTIPDKDISDMSEAEIADLEHSLRALKDAKRAGAIRPDGGDDVGS